MSFLEADAGARTTHARRAREFFTERERSIFRHTDRLFVVLMSLQWIAGIFFAIWISPRAWAGSTSYVHPHVWAAVFLGGAISFFPILLAILRPGEPSTRFTIAVAQMLAGALLIHLTGGRIETHFHVFGSLAFLAFYRDWRVLVPATLVVAADHFLRGVFWPESVYGVLAPSQWRWLEHAGWVIFEDIFLIVSIVRVRKEMWVNAERTSELEAGEARNRELVENASDAIYTHDLEGNYTSLNAAGIRITGYTLDEALRMKMSDVLAPEYLQLGAENLYRKLAGEEPASYELEILAKDGRRIPFEVNSRLLYENGSPVGVQGIGRDITERKRAEEALRESEEKYRTILEHIEDGYFEVDLRGVYTFVNDAFCRIVNYPATELLGSSYKKFFDQDAARFLFDAFHSVYKTGQPLKAFGYAVRTLEGSYKFVEDSVSLKRDAKGTPIGFMGVRRDVTERRLAEEALNEANHRAITEYQHLLGKISSLAQGLGTARDLETVFRTLLDFARMSAPCDTMLVSLYDPENNLRTITYGWSDGEEIDVTHLPGIQVNDDGFVGLAIKTQEVSISSDHIRVSESRRNAQIDTSDTNPRAHSALAAPMTLKGRIIGVVEVHSCEESAFRAEHRTAMQMAANLAAISVENVRLFEREREREEQLRQSQKMEAVGKLAGGVAHDFNNLLTAITGYSALSLRKLSPEDPIHRNINEIKKAGDRAAGLTRQLLAFSRKQVLQPKVMNLNAIVADISKLLQRLIGEDIALIVKPDSSLGQIKADPSQLEQVLVNLAVNARDAMPMGGRLTVETSNVALDAAYASRHVAVTPGQYVMLAVSDTGHGMDESIQARVFEPFFTTKEIGKGTGLGLSTVYGIIKQSGGNIWVYSEVGIGTTFKIYLPRVDGTTAVDDDERNKVDEIPQGSETILLVEDEAFVREMTTQVLRESGYQVLVASHGSEALEVAANYEGTVDLLLSDVVMPKMGGRELVERLGPKRPSMRVLYMSGYTDDAISHHGVLDPGTQFIEKPFTPESIIQKVRSVLNETAKN